MTYWDELTRVFDWTQTHVHSTFGVCWAGMAMLKHFHGVEKHMLAAKAFGCFRHAVAEPASPYLRGFSDEFVIPVSRWTEVRQTEIDTVPGLQTLLTSAEVGPCLIEDRAPSRALHLQPFRIRQRYALKQEYDRDVANGTPIKRAPQLLSRG